MNEDEIKKKAISDYMRQLGKKGGEATKKARGREYYVNMARSKKGGNWTWDPAKKGKRKPKDKTPTNVIDTITPPETNS